MTNVPHAQDVGDEAEDVGDEYEDVNVPHVADVAAVEEGGRLEPKWYRNKNQTRRLYYVIRFERRHTDGRRYRPMRYVGINPPSGVAIGLASNVPHVQANVPHAGPHAREDAGPAAEA